MTDDDEFDNFLAGFNTGHGWFPPTNDDDDNKGNRKEKPKADTCKCKSPDVRTVPIAGKTYKVCHKCKKEVG